MSNTWLKSKTVVWVLIIVFLFTSVFTTSNVFAETEQTDGNDTQFIPTDAFEYIDVRDIAENRFMPSPLKNMTSDGQLDIIISSDYADVDLELIVCCKDGYELFSVGGEELSSFEIFSLGNSIDGKFETIAFVLKNSDGTINKTINVTVYATEDPHIDGITVNNLSFTDDFDGQIIMTDDVTSKTISLDVDITADEYQYDRIILLFNNTSEYCPYEAHVYLQESAKFNTSFTVDFNSNLKEGTYELTKITTPDGEKIRNESESILSFNYGIEISDEEPPVLNDIYFTLDGDKCETQGFYAEEGQNVQLWIDVTDDSKIDKAYVDYEYMDANYMDTDVDTEISRAYFTYDEERELYVADLHFNNSNCEYYITEVCIADQYFNTNNYYSTNDKRLEKLFFYHGTDKVIPEYKHEVYFNTPVNNPITSHEVTTTRVTSFEEMGIEPPKPVDVRGAEFVGWAIVDNDNINEIIKTTEQKIMLNRNGISVFRPVYSQNVAAINVLYHNSEWQWMSDYIYLGISKGTTYGDLRDFIIENDYLDEIEHETYMVFQNWEYTFSNDEDDEMPYGGCIHATAIYNDERTLYADGGVFADGSTEKKVNIDINEEEWLDNLEKPEREGYIFHHWEDGDGCYLYELNTGCDDEIHAIWMSADRPALDSANIAYNYSNKTAEDKIWSNGNAEEITLPSTTDLESVEIIIKKYDGTVENIPVIFENGKAKVEYVSEHIDEKNTTTYTLNLTIQELQTAPWGMELVYDGIDSQGETQPKIEPFEFMEDGTARIILNKEMAANRSLGITGYDADGSPIDMRITLDADKTGECTFTSVNGKVYTIKFVKKTFEYVNISTYIGQFYNYKNISVDTSLLEKEKKATIEIPSNYTKASLSIRIKVDEPNLLMHESEEPSVFKSVHMHELEAGETKTVKFIVKNEKGAKETYRVIVSATGTPDTEFEKRFKQKASEVSFKLDANGGAYKDGSKSKTYTVLAGKPVSLKGYEGPVRKGYVFAGWQDDIGNFKQIIEEWLWGEDGPFSYKAIWCPENKAGVRSAYVKYDYAPYEPTEHFIWEDGKTVDDVTLPYDIIKESVAVVVENVYGQRTEIPVTFDENEEASIDYTAVSYDGTASVDYTAGIEIEKPSAELNYIKVLEHEDFDEVCGDLTTMNDNNELDITIPICYLESEVTLDIGTKAGGIIYSEDGARLGREYSFEIDALKTDNIETFVFSVEARDDSETRTYNINVIASGHNYKTKVTKPTCTERGFTTYTCKCGNEYVDDYEDMIPALGHDFSKKYTVDKKATFTRDGSKSHHCSRCDETDTAVKIPKIASAKLSYTKKDYTGKAITAPTVTVKDSEGNKLVKGTDYTVTGLTNKTKVGRYAVTITFKGEYSGTKKLYFTITPKAPTTTVTRLVTGTGGYDDIKFIWSKSVGASGYYVYYKKASDKNYTYLTRTTGTSVTKKGLSDGTRYFFKVVPYYKNGDTRYASLTYKTGNTYTLKKVSTPKITRNGTKVKISWTNIAGESGYQISMSTTKTGTKIVTTYPTTKGTYKNLTAEKGKKYYYKVRAYKNVTVGGKTYKVYGPWSGVKSFKR